MSLCQASVLCQFNVPMLSQYTYVKSVSLCRVSIPMSSLSRCQVSVSRYQVSVSRYQVSVLISSQCPYATSIYLCPVSLMDLSQTNLLIFSSRVAGCLEMMINTNTISLYNYVYNCIMYIHWHNTSAERVEEVGKSVSSSQMLIIGVLAAIIIVVISGVVLLLVCRRRKKQKEKSKYDKVGLKLTFSTFFGFFCWHFLDFSDYSHYCFLFLKNLKMFKISKFLFGVIISMWFTCLLKDILEG